MKKSRRALLPVVLVAFGVLAIGCCGPSPEGAAIVDDEIASLGTGAKAGLTPEDVKAVADDIAPLATKTRAHVFGIIAKGLRTPQEIARINSAVTKVQARWKKSQ